MKNKILLLIFLLFQGLIWAQNEIKVTVINADTKSPIPFVKVEVVETKMYYKTDLKGEFTIKNLAEGTYQFKINEFGYESYLMTHSIQPQTTHLTLSVTASEKVLDEVTVHGESDENGVMRKMRAVEGVLISKGKKTEVIQVDKININQATGTGRQLYATIPGLNIWESDGAGIQLGIGGRGLSPTRTSNYNTRQNGYDISADALGYPESYYTPPTEIIQEIQLIRGAASLQFGTQFGGLLNFVTKTGPENKKFELTASHTIGSFGLNSSFISVGGSTPTLNYYAYYKYKFGDDWRPNSAFKVHNAGLYVSKYFSEKFKISLELTKMHYLTQQPGGLTDLQFETDPYQSNRDRNWFEIDWNLAAVQMDYEINSHSRINSRFFGLIASRKALGFLGQINRVDPLEERNLIWGDYKNFGNETRYLNVYKVKQMSWAYVAGFRYYQGYSLSRQGLANDGYGADFYYLNPDHLESSSYEFPSRNISLFAEHIFNLNSHFSITPGIRYEYIKTSADGYYRNIVEDLAGNVIFDSTYYESKVNSRDFIIAGLGLTYKWSDSLELYGNLSQNYRSINFTDMQIQNPNFQIDPNLQDERGFNSDIGIRGGIPKKWSYDVSVFALYYANRIGTTIQVDSVLYNTYQYRTNIAASLTKGVEAYVNFDLWHWFINHKKDFKLDWFVNTSFVDAKYISSEEPAYDGNKVELVPPFNVKTGLTFGYKTFSATYQYSYTHKHFSDATNSVSQANAVNGIIPSYQVMDLSIKYTYKWLQISTGINNLSNEMYFTRRATGYPGPGIIPSTPRNYYLSLQIKL